MHAKTSSQGAPARRMSVLVRYWVPHRSHAVRVGCAHLQAENDALYDRLQQRHDHAAEAPPHKCGLPSARSTATLSSQALCEGESVTATTPRGAPIFTVDFGRSDPPSPLLELPTPIAIPLLPWSRGTSGKWQQKRLKPSMLRQCRSSL